MSRKRRYSLTHAVLNHNSRARETTFPNPSFYERLMRFNPGRQTSALGSIHVRQKKPFVAFTTK